MRIAAIDAAVDDARVERALHTALAKAPDRVFLFGHAIDAAIRIARHDLEHRDERFLDVAAAYVLDANANVKEPPSRARMSIPVVEISVAIAAPDRDCAPIASSVRAIEMIGSHLCMAIADAASLADDEIDNAALWIGGGGGAFRVEHIKSRTVLCPGDVANEGSIAIVDANVNELRIARLDADGHVVDARQAAVTANARMSVQG